MGREYVTREVDKIMLDESLAFPENLALASAWILGNLKGVNLKILSVKELTALSDYFVLGSAGNAVQARAMADEIITQLKRHKHAPISIEGVNNAEWILVDFGDIIIHIFLEVSRNIYDLDRLWKDASSINIPQSYYFSSLESEDEEKNISVPSRSYY